MANKNAERFMRRALMYFKFIGFEFEPKSSWRKLLYTVGLINMSLTILGQLLFVALSDADLEVIAPGVIYVFYFLVSIGKIIALLYNRSAIRNALIEFRKLYPSEETEKTFNLQKYLRDSILIETILETFFRGVTLFYNAYPIAVSIIDLYKDGVFSYKVPLMEWYPFEVENNWMLYTLVVLHQIIANYYVAITILGLDICLFSSLIQLSMHFDLISRRILQIEPSNRSEDAEKKLKKEIVYHQEVLRLAENVNYIFTPSVLFSLLSSSFIICFTGYQLLGDISLMIVFRAIVLLGYELKQVVITCVLGDRLMEISLKVSDVIYEHKWYNGTPKYKRLVLVVLARSQKSAALNIAGISSVTLQTLRSVMSISYQIFTVLKTS